MEYRDVVAEHKAATDRLHELMNEYLAAKKAEREVTKIEKLTEFFF